MMLPPMKRSTFSPVNCACDIHGDLGPMGPWLGASTNAPCGANHNATALLLSRSEPGVFLASPSNILTGCQVTVPRCLRELVPAFHLTAKPFR